MLDSIEVEIAHVEGGQGIVNIYRLLPGATVGDALRRLSQEWPVDAWIAGERAVGVFGRVVGRDFVLTEGDRVELYSPLLNDPKAARRQRAAIAAKKKR